jgi:hypothetical protein
MNKRSDTAPRIRAAPASAGSAFVRLFKSQFAAAVRSGQKIQTIRPTPKRMPKRGDKISLREWTGKPYRSKQRVLRESTITKVEPVQITSSAIVLNGVPLTGAEQHRFAVADGFLGANELIGWFNSTHGLPFEGVVISWQNSNSATFR